MVFWQEVSLFAHPQSPPGGGDVTSFSEFAHFFTLEPPRSIPKVFLPSSNLQGLSPEMQSSCPHLCGPLPSPWEPPQCGPAPERPLFSHRNRAPGTSSWRVSADNGAWRRKPPAQIWNVELPTVPAPWSPGAETFQASSHRVPFQEHWRGHTLPASAGPRLDIGFLLHVHPSSGSRFSFPWSREPPPRLQPLRSARCGEGAGAAALRASLLGPRKSIFPIASSPCGSRVRFQSADICN